MYVTAHARTLRVASAAALRLGTLAAGSKENRNEAAGDVTPGAAAPAPATAALAVADVDLGRGISNARVTDKTDDFKTTDTVYASVRTTGTSANSNLMARWTFEDGQVVDESTHAVQAAGTDYTEFHVSKPDGWPKGKYQVEILLDGQPVERRSFDVGGA